MPNWACFNGSMIFPKYLAPRVIDFLDKQPEEREFYNNYIFYRTGITIDNEGYDIYYKNDAGEELIELTFSGQSAWSIQGCLLDESTCKSGEGYKNVITLVDFCRKFEVEDLNIEGEECGMGIFENIYMINTKAEGKYLECSSGEINQWKCKKCGETINQMDDPNEEVYECCECSDYCCDWEYISGGKATNVDKYFL